MNKIISLAMVLALAGCAGADDTSTSDPIITSTPVEQATENTPYNYKLSVTDTDTAQYDLTWAGNPLPDWLNIEQGAVEAITIPGGNVLASAVTADANGNIFAIVNSCDLVQVNADGTQTQLANISSTNSGPSCLGLVSVGTKLYFSNYYKGEIYSIDTSNIAAGATVISTKADSGPVAISENDGFIYVANFSSRSVDRIEISKPSNRTEILSDLDGPYGTSFDDNGNIYVSLITAGKVIRYNNAMELDASFELTAGQATDVEIDINGNIYVSSWFIGIFGATTDAFIGVTKFDGDTLAATEISTGAIFGMTMNPQGELIWGNTDTSKIQKLETQAVVLAGTPTRNDGGAHDISLTVSDGTNTDTQTFTINVEIANSQPSGTVTISGALQEGSVLTAENDLVDTDGLGDISYLWYADGIAITDATSATLTLTSAQVGKAITVIVSYTDDYNFEEAVASAATATVVTNTLPTGTLTIHGEPIDGGILYFTNQIEDADGISTATSFQWYADDEAIEDATSGAITLTSSQVGTVITVKAFYTDDLGYEEEVTSAATAVVTFSNSLPTGNLTITGDLIEGKVLTASNDLQDANGLGEFSYQWHANGNAIADATSDTFYVTSAQVGTAITVKVIYTDGNGFEEEISSAASALVSGLTNNRTQAIAANGAIMALLQKDGSVMTWGDNTYGTMGHTAGTSSDTTVIGFPSYIYNPNAATISDLTGVTSIAVGYRFILALKNDGTVWAWGRNENGELGHEPGTNNDSSISDDYGNLFSDFDGDGDEYYNTTPMQVPGLSGVVAIDANYASAVALKSDGTVWAWGDNSFGQLGDGNGAFGIQSYIPVQVNDNAGTGNLTDIVAIHASDFGMFASESDGTLWAWGGNSNGQLGLGDNNDKLTPTQHTLTNVIDIAMSGQLNVALKIDGTVSYWGDTQTTPTDSGLVGVAEITSAGNSAIALLTNGTAMAWGMNVTGQLGDGTTATIATPTAIFAADTFVDVTMGEFFSAALLDDGSVKTWGNNGYGQLGHAPNSNGDVQPVVDGDIYNLASVTISYAAANNIYAPSEFTANFSGVRGGDWASVDGAVSYNLYWSRTPGVSVLNGNKIENVNSGWVIEGLEETGRYYIMVTAVDAAGNESVSSLEVATDADQIVF